MAQAFLHNDSIESLHVDLPNKSLKAMGDDGIGIFVKMSWSLAFPSKVSVAYQTDEGEARDSLRLP